VSEYFLIAKIISVYSKNGFLKTNIYSEYPERFKFLKKVFIDFWGDKKLFFIEEIKEINNTFLFKFKNFDSIRETELLAGREIYVDDNSVIRLPENNYFLHDLVGCKVFINDKFAGIVKDALNTPANDVLVIEDEFGKELMLPFVLAYIESVDTDNKILKLRNLELDSDDKV